MRSNSWESPDYWIVLFPISPVPRNSRPESQKGLPTPNQVAGSDDQASTMTETDNAQLTLCFANQLAGYQMLRVRFLRRSRRADDQSGRIAVSGTQLRTKELSKIRVASYGSLRCGTSRQWE